MRQTEFRAMGTDVVAVGVGSRQRVVDWFDAAEDVFSRFRGDSELSRLNESGAETAVVSETMAACLRTAQLLKDKTNGLVDPAVGSLTAAWGYDRTFVEVVDLDTAPAIEAAGTWSIVGNTFSRRSGTRLDLGGIAKGWTCDTAVEAGLAEVVSAGGDVRSSHLETVVSIEDPWGGTALRARLGVGGLATSSTTRRRWRVAGKPAHHLIDPRTLAPADTPIFSATVVADTAVEAEAGAKAVLLQGEFGLVWAEQQPWIRAALVAWHDGSIYATTGWEEAA
jgi:thiamine biosynthesis lipoprotein